LWSGGDRDARDDAIKNHRWYFKNNYSCNEHTLIYSNSFLVFTVLFKKNNMNTNIILLFTTLSYSIIVAQSFMYIVALKNVQNHMNARSYIELRKLLDANFRANYKYAVYAALVTNLILVLVNIQSPGSLLFISSTIAFIALIADVVLMMKGNMPINNLINTWTTDTYPATWSDYRKKWLRIFYYREIATITGFISLITGAVFR